MCSRGVRVKLRAYEGKRRRHVHGPVPWGRQGPEFRWIACQADLLGRPILPCTRAAASRRFVIETDTGPNPSTFSDMYMIYSLVFALLGVQQNPAQQQQPGDQKQSLDQIRTLRQDELKPGCTADASWRFASPPQGAWDAQPVVTLTLLSSVRVPRDSCLPAAVHVRVNYYDGGGAFVCGCDTVLTQRDATQNTYFEIRPLNIEYFFRRHDGPTGEQSDSRRLICYDRRGFEIREPNDRSASVKVFATVFPKSGGLAIAETTIPLPRPIAPLPRPIAPPLPRPIAPPPAK